LPEAAATVEIRAAGELVLREFQLDLEHLPSPVDPQLARSIMRERLWAVSALIRLGRSWAVGAGTGHKYAKEIQLEVTGGTPLTICIGDVCEIVV